jgi:L-amino acid N-acyltransferase YncA
VSGVTIRTAAASDAAAVARIYNEGIAERLATFETRSRSASEVAGWLGDGLPFLVAERATQPAAPAGTSGDVVGWARVSPYSDRCVYDGVGEHGVYVARSARGAGIGRMLLEALCDEAAGRGFYKLTSRVFTDNGPSRAVHLAAGFEEIGVQRRHGRLDGRWKDCVLVERLLGDAADPPLTGRPALPG